MKEIVDPFTGRRPDRAKAAATRIVRIDRPSPCHRAADADEGRHAPTRPSVPLAWTRLPDARASIPVGPCMPMPARRYFEARHGHHVRVRCRLPDIDGQPIIE
jgi:hypothetical protein